MLHSEEKKYLTWKKEFETFLGTPEQSVPASLSKNIQNYVRAELQCHPAVVFTKLLIVHFFSGSLTLFFCPQFGVDPIGGGHGLMSILMKWGDWACALGCGTFFLGATSLATHIALNSAERQVLTRHQLWQFSLLGFLSIVVLMIVSRIYHGSPTGFSGTYSVAWWIGGSLGATVIFQSLHSIRSHFTQC